MKININQGCADLRSQRAHKSSTPDGIVWIRLSEALFTQAAHGFCRTCTLSHLTASVIYVLSLFQAFHAFHHGYSISWTSTPMHCWALVLFALENTF